MASIDFISCGSSDFLFLQGLSLATGQQRLDRFHEALSLINSVSLLEICRDIPHPLPPTSVAACAKENIWQGLKAR